MFKKILSIFLAAMMIFGLSACNSMESAETSVTNYLNAVKAQDKETIAKYSGNEAAEETTEETPDDFSQYMMDELLGNMNFEILSSEESEETATVKVAFTNVNMSIVMSEVFAEAFSLIFADLSDEELDTAMQGFFVKALENHSEDVVTKEVDLQLAKGDGYWIIEPTDEMLDAAIGGLQSALSNIS